MPITLEDVLVLSEGETDYVTVACDDYLDIDSLEVDEKITDFDSLTEVGSSDLDISLFGINTVRQWVLGRWVPPRQSIKFFCSGQLTTGGPNGDGNYTIAYQVTTDKGRKPVRYISMVCV